MKLLVISDAPIIERDGLKLAYAPYVKEMDLWMKQVSQVTILSPAKYSKKLLWKPFANQNFQHQRVIRLEFHKWSSALKSLIATPSQTVLLWKAFKKADHIHVRAPGNLALLAGIIGAGYSFFNKKRSQRKTVKYAGNWDPNSKQPLSYRLQKWLFASPKWSKNTTVMAYGEWPNQSKNVKSFFTATYSEKEIQKYKKTLGFPLQFVFAGTLAPNKNPQLLVELVQELNQQGIPSEAHFYGDGPMMEEFKQLHSKSGEPSYEFGVQSSAEDACNVSSSAVENSSTIKDLEPTTGTTFTQDSVTPSSEAVLQRLDSSISNTFHFHGNQPTEVLKQAYEKAHFVFLASQSEGWPKVVAEGMWHGCVPIATPVSFVPWMLNINAPSISDNPRGILFNSVQETVEKIKGLIAAPDQFEQMSKDAQKWSQQYTMEGFQKCIEELLK
ncbi:glycosyltransferase [Nonlabens antarcticus]|uniref:glycosyltransferase n=1 Tax=Nonlabens antarcticus TaxID=392714 RepID=UPI00189183DE|nr:glycosyltransferase [Nonlabens antarcticus]